MTTEDITQKLALLPAGLAEKNIKSWENVLQFYKMAASLPSNSWLTPMVNMIQTVIDSGQHKLFQAGLQLYTLIVSAKEEYGLDSGEHHIRVDIDNNNSIEVWYGTSSTDSETLIFDGNKITLELQPFLDKLWNETRGKKNT
jgi:hypothetical protein